MSEIALALGGGGIRGIAHIGVIRELEKNGFTIKSIAGTSIGGLIGSVYAAGHSTYEILEFFDSIDRTTMFRRQVDDKPSVLGLKGITEKLTDLLGDKTFDQLKIPFACTAVDINTSQEVILTKARVVDAVLATIAVPGVFPPKPIGNTLLVDGGMLDPVPTTLARWQSPQLPVISVCLSNQPKEWKFDPRIQIPPSTPIPVQIVEQISKLRISQAFNLFVNSFDIMSVMLTELRLEKDKPDVIIRPKVGHLSILESTFDSEKLVQLGIDSVREKLHEIHQAFSLQKKITRLIMDNKKPGEILDPKEN